MSLLRDFEHREVTAFGGAWLLNDPTNVDTRGALRSQNVEYVAGMVGTRHGFGVISLSGVYQTSRLYAWYAPIVPILGSSYSDSALVSYSPSSAIVTAVNLKTGTDLFAGAAVVAGTPIPAGASFEGVGARLYAAFHSSSQRGNIPFNTGRVYTLRSAGGYTESQLFQHPIRGSGGAFGTEPAAGSITVGLHRFGLLLEYASGFTTRPSPDSGSTTPPSVSSFAPYTFTASGSKNMVVSITWGAVDLPSDVIAASIIMTTVTNLNQYYVVPGSRQASGPSTTNTWTINISDGDLSSQGIDATPYLYLLTAASSAVNGASSGVPPFSPAHLCLFGDRMAYKASQVDNENNAIDCLYVSDRNAYQNITADQHVLYLPGQRNITTMFHMGTVNYIVGPHEIYAVTDNGDVPVTWSAPHLVDGRHGTLAIHGVEVAPSGNYAWVADQSGLYLFTGSPITGLAVSYYQLPDWERINWAVAYTLQIRDDAGSKRVRVMAALDSATTPSHMMTWDYTDGISADTVRYSLDSLSGYSMGAMELVRNDLAGQATANQQLIELWLGPSSGTTYLRQLSGADTNPYRDNGAAIGSAYRTCPLPGREATGGLVLMHHGFAARLRGSGTVTPTLYDVDAARSFTCRQVTLAAAPDQDLIFRADLRNELAFVEFTSNTIDTHWQLAYLKYYFSPYLIQR